MQTTERPRFRQDLVAEAIEDHGARFIDVMDPDSGNLFRFYEVEYSLACAMDGQRDVPGIVQWARDELGVTPSPAEVRSVIATLGSLGFIEGGAEPELMPGVVVGARSTPAAQHVDLGQAGTTRGHVNDMPAAPNIALGAPGAAPQRPHPPVEDIPLGASGAGQAPPERRTPEPGRQILPSVAAPSMRDVSVDLSEQMAVRRDDVKEAVRASKVMSAAEVPRDLLVPSDDDKTIKAPAPVMDAHLPARQQAKQPEPAKGAKPAVELRQPTPVPKLVTPVPEPPPERRTSAALLVVLILVLLGGAAFLIWKYVLDTGDSTTSSSSTSQTQPAAKPAPPAEPKNPPPAAKAKLTTDQPPSQEIKAPGAGVVEAVEPNDKPIKAGDAVVWLAGHKALEDQMATLTTEIEKKLPQDIANDQKDRDAADKAGNKGDVAAMEKRLADRQKTLETKTAQRDQKKADLEKLVVKAPASGKLVVVAKPGAKVNRDDVVAKIAREPVLAASFAIPKEWAGRKLAVDGAAKLRDDAHPEKVYDCTVAEVTDGGAKIKVTCPLDPTLDGVAVTLVDK